MENTMEFIVNEIFPIILLGILIITICFIGNDISIIKKEIQNTNISEKICVKINNKNYCEVK